MTSQARWPAFLLAPLAACLVAYLFPQLFDRPTPAQTLFDPSIPKFDPAGQIPDCILLAEALPNSVYSHQHRAYNKSLEGYWSLPATQLRPSCIVQPVNAAEVSTAIKVLKTAYDASEPVRFAVRSGGHSPEAGFASIHGGVLIETSLINEITLSEDKKTAILGVGARWHNVSSKLDHLGLAIVGGRNANVGVGGLVVGGGISFFSPRYGMVCDNIDSYEIVLADSTITQITSTSHPDLFRSLKGGTGNFGIVTRITARTFPSTNIWSGYIFWLNRQASTVLSAFHDFNKIENFDEYAAGPILALAYSQSLGIRPIALSLAYTKPEIWAPVFQGFKNIWHLWTTTKIRSLSAATEELAGMAPYGQRQFQATTTIKNDLETFEAFRQIYDSKFEQIRSVRSGVWSLVYQPLSAAVMHKGSPNVLGFESRALNDTLVIVLVAVGYADPKDDALVQTVAREIISEGASFARERGTADDYVYLNYAASGEDVFGGYGEENRKFLQDVSRKYDPDGFWQRAKEGGFKLDLKY